MANIKYRKSDGTYETITNYNVQPLVPVQETGDSVINVMSQKAVTDAINNITVEAGQNIDVKDKVISAKGYIFDETNKYFSINDDFYLCGVGKYDGTNPTESQTLQTVINNNLDIVNTRTYTLDFGTSSDLIQDINMIGNITINNIQTYNVNKLFITYGNVVHSEITNFTDMGISIDKNSRIIWEIERINDEELACVGIESKLITN